jgi:hypothetical protein
MSTLNGVTIYTPNADEFTGEPVLGELHVLDASADTLHNAGSHSRFKEIDFWLLDVSQYTTIEAAFKAGTTVTYVDWRGNTHSVKIRSLSGDPITDIKRPPYYSVIRGKAKLMKI